MPTGRPFGLFCICNFVYFVNNVNIVNVEHLQIWSLYIFCNPLLQNIIQVKCLTLYSNEKASNSKFIVISNRAPRIKFGSTNRVGSEKGHYKQPTHLHQLISNFIWLKIIYIFNKSNVGNEVLP